MRATKRSVTATAATAAALAGAALLAGAPASAAHATVSAAPVGGPGPADAAVAAALQGAKAEAGSNVLRPGEALRPGDPRRQPLVRDCAAGERQPGVRPCRGQEGVVLHAHVRKPGAVTRMNEDGNLVVYDSETKEALWASNTSGNPDAWLQVRDDGGLAIYGQDGKILWSRHNLISEMHVGQKLTNDRYISSVDRQYHLIMQKPGNLVLYNKQTEPVWANDTTGVPGSYATLQGDGNLVIIDPNTGEAPGPAGPPAAVPRR